MPVSWSLSLAGHAGWGLQGSTLKEGCTGLLTLALSPLSFFLPGMQTRWLCSSSHLGPQDSFAVGSHIPRRVKWNFGRRLALASLVLFMQDKKKKSFSLNCRHMASVLCIESHAGRSIPLHSSARNVSLFFYVNVK